MKREVMTVTLLLAAAGALAADDAEVIARRIGRGDPLAGKEKSRVEVCVECHGADGHSEEPKFPKLAGQYARYIEKQLRDFQSGARKHEIMNPMAGNLNDAALMDIAAYFASQSPMKGEVPVANPVGEALFRNGDPARNVPACSICHGADGKGGMAGDLVYPSIGGQHRGYLRSQLLDWKISARANSPGGVMNHVTRSLTNDEIGALASYLSGL